MRKVNVLKIYTDGGARGNPGPSAAGVVIMDTNNKVLDSYGIYLGEGTNNRAEYLAVRIALEKIEKYIPNKIDFYIDSELVVRQLNGLYRVKNQDLKLIYLDIKKIAAKYNINFSHVVRAKNNLADQQVNIAIDLALGIEKPKQI